MATAQITTNVFTFNNDTTHYRITDTVYYNDRWQICEKPMAMYWRNGTLSSYRNAWYYMGEVKDYSIDDNHLIMQGNYSYTGIREGKFRFFYPNGKVRAFGEYNRGRPFGYWYWYYPNGNQLAIVYFPFNDQDFSISSFSDPDGNLTIKDGTGDFSWYTRPFDTTTNAYAVSGSFKSGKRIGKWQYKYISDTGKSSIGFTEKYNKSGEYVNTVYDNYKSWHSPTYVFFQFIPFELETTEGIRYDPLFGLNGYNSSLFNLSSYLIEHKPAEADLAKIPFDSAFKIVLATLERYKYKIRFHDKKTVNGKLKFMIGSKAIFEDVSFSGEGLDLKELNFFTFLLGKFKNIEQPGDDKVGIEVNYVIYCFTIDLKDVLPAKYKSSNTTDLIFSFKPREKVEEYLKEHKDEIKKYYRKL